MGASLGLAALLLTPAALVAPPSSVPSADTLAALVVPDDLRVTATCGDGTVMGVRHCRLPLHGVQFHPESILSEHGARMVATFLGER